MKLSIIYSIFILNIVFTKWTQQDQQLTFLIIKIKNIIYDTRGA